MREDQQFRWWENAFPDSQFDQIDPHDREMYLKRIEVEATEDLARAMERVASELEEIAKMQRKREHSNVWNALLVSLALLFFALSFIFGGQYALILSGLK